MAKIKTIFVCQSCAAKTPKWLGRCPECGAWNSYVEETPQGEVAATRRLVPEDRAATPQRLHDVAVADGAHQPVGMPELDRVLGGGLVPGSLVMLGGDPGIGKSTIVLQALGLLAARNEPVLYVTGEESAAQVRSRADRLGIDTNTPLWILTENALEPILHVLKRETPRVCVIDSIQTIYTSQLDSSPGTVSQLRETAAQLLYATKAHGFTTILIGHVTKDGQLAGPKTLEHMVDTVLYFEGERGHQFRILRAVKNRFGSTNEIGVFEMTGEGLQQVQNPSERFLSERPVGAPGSVVAVPIEGTRPVLVELQALVSHSGLSNPRRTVIGVDSQRVSLLSAVLEKVAGCQLGDHDIFLNVAGGLKLVEPAIDLGILVAIASSFRNKPLDAKTALIGEVGLTGEIRAVSGLDARIAEAARMGFTTILVPANQAGIATPRGVALVATHHIMDALEQLG